MRDEPARQTRPGVGCGQGSRDRSGVLDHAALPPLTTPGSVTPLECRSLALAPTFFVNTAQDLVRGVVVGVDLGELLGQRFHANSPLLVRDRSQAPRPGIDVPVRPLGRSRPLEIAHDLVVDFLGRVILGVDLGEPLLILLVARPPLLVRNRSSRLPRPGLNIRLKPLDVLAASGL
jgi:hypothetical protein